MKRAALTISVMSFFALAATGWYCGHSPLTCAIRAVIGAAAMFVVAMLIGRVIVSIMVDSLIDTASGNRTDKEEQP